jgi:hypothetical protein
MRFKAGCPKRTSENRLYSYQTLDFVVVMAQEKPINANELKCVIDLT